MGDYEVESILDKRVNGRKEEVIFFKFMNISFIPLFKYSHHQIFIFQYLLKWKKSKRPQWIQKGNMNCDELLVSFEKSRGPQILGKY